MTNSTSIKNLSDEDLDNVDGAGFIEPVITRKPLTGLVGYREEFGVERPKGQLSIEGIEYGSEKPKFKI